MMLLLIELGKPFDFFVETGFLSRYEQSFLIKTRARLKMITRLKTILIE